MMATRKTTSVTNYDATPPKMSDKSNERGRLKATVETIEVAAADADGDIMAIAIVRSSDVVVDVQLLNDAITSGTDYDLGLYDTDENGAAVVDVNAFADAVDMSSARVVWSSMGFEAGGRNIADCKKQVWELLGLSSDPGKDYVLAWTGVTIGSAAGTISTLVLILEGD
jgi:hypothetical protein